MPVKPAVHHIPVCPFCQRVEILLGLKEQRGAVDFHVIDITKPRDPALLKKTRGTTMLPVLETAEGRIIKESLVILDYLDETLPGGQVRRTDPYERAVERMLIAREGAFTTAGYMFVMNQDKAKRQDHLDGLVKLYAGLDDFLLEHNPDGTYLFQEFGLAEAVFTPMFARFWFLEYYEGFALPADERFARVAKWREACLEHPAAQQASREEIVKLYYDYAQGAGNGALLPGRSRSSFAFEPHWKERPWPPAEKYGAKASDETLGLL
ncbi:MAG: glutathione S-transferase family protein [Flavobacteriaceae bacterium]